MCHYHIVIRKGIQCPHKYHDFQMLTTKKSCEHETRNCTQEKHTASWCHHILISVPHLLYLQEPKLILLMNMPLYHSRLA